MSIFDKFKKQENKVLQQDLSKKEKPGMVFVMHLLMKEMTPMPEKEEMISLMEKHLGKVDCFSYDNQVAGLAVEKYQVQFEQGAIPPQLMIMGCCENKREYLNPLNMSQMWDCPEAEKVFEENPYEIIVTDMMAAGLPYKDRANMLMDFMEALVELYPQCGAVYFQTSGKLMTVDKIKNHSIPRDHRFIYFAVNMRFFYIQGTQDSVVDSLGMSTLFLPDLQYHFHGMDPNWVVNHGYNLLSYLYDNDCLIKSGETVDGIVSGEMNREVQWRCQYEEALIQPAREVLDICMNEYAAGQRD